MILLDTHTLVWWLLQSPKLSKKANSQISQAIERKELIFISSITIWEISLLAATKKLELSRPIDEWLKKAQEFPEFKYIPVDNTIAYQSTVLPGTFHKDPADRFIVATAIINNASIVTQDTKIHRYKHVTSIW